MARDRKGRFTAERTTETTTTRVTERLTAEPPIPPAQRPVITGRPLDAYGFTHLLSHPPAQRWAHPKFIAEMAARPVIDHTDPYPPRARRHPVREPFIQRIHDDLPAAEFVPRSRVYRELDPDTLDAAYLTAPLEPLP